MTNPPMQLARRRVLQGLAGIGAMVLAGPTRSQAQAPAWPDRPVRLIVGFPAGTSPDLLARLLTEPMAARFGQPFVAVNRPGANGNIGAAAVATANDGHTFGVVGAGALTGSPHLYANPGFKLADFAPVTVIGTSPLLLVGSTTTPFNHPREFIAEAKKAGDRWNYGSPGIGSNGHLSMELLKEKTGMTAVHVPFPGIPAVLTAIMQGDIQMAIVPIGNAMTQVQAGKIRAVGLTASAPSPLAPGVPPLTEAGVADFTIESWNAVMAPVSTAAPILTSFGDTVRTIIRSDTIRDKLFAQGWVADGGSADALQRRIATDGAMYGRIIQSRKIRVDG